jgi:SAM-dependent methyltransferase
MENLLLHSASESGPAAPRALVLGVTPELLGMNWPDSTRLLAIDRCPDMIRSLPPASGSTPASAVCGHWLRLPLRDQCCDLIAGDGCMTVLESPDDHRHFGAELARVLSPRGRLGLRLFVRPAAGESPERVLADLSAGRIGNFHVFKWRLAMALANEPDGVVGVSEIWQAWKDSGFQASELAADLNWSRPEIETIEAYREASARYTFPRLDQARSILSLNFQELDCRTSGYELGERCPTLLLAPRH